MRDPTSRPARTLSAASIIVPPALVGVLALLIVTRGALWQDEVATYTFALLDPVSLVRATGHVDAVVAPYYLLCSFVQHLVPGEFGLRLPSILAVAGTSVLVVVIARRWWGRWPGAVAGVAFALNPYALSMATTARPLAIATLFLALALYLLDAAVSRSRARGWVLFSLSLAAAGLFQLFSLAMAPAFVVRVWGRRRRVVAWVAASAVAALIVAPLAVVGFTQRAQISWISQRGVRGAVAALASVFDPYAEGDLRTFAALAAVLAGAGIAIAVFLRARRREEARFVAVALAVLVTPTLVLGVVSRVVAPVLDPHYLAPSSLGIALLLGGMTGAGITLTTHRRPRRTTVAFAAALALLALVPTAVAVRPDVQQVAYPERINDFPGLAAWMRANLRDGDRLVVLQAYNDGGLASAVALYGGDRRWFDELQARLPTGTQPVVNVRTVRSGSPLSTTASSTAPSGGTGRIWLVGTTTAVVTPSLIAAGLSSVGCARGRIVPVATYGFTALTRGVCVTG